MLATTVLLAAPVVLLVVAVWQLSLPPHLKYKGVKPWKMPPGPKAYPIVGNLVNYFRMRRSGKLHAWLHSLPKYGEMTTLHMGNRTWVVINSDRVAEAIIAKAGKLTAERPNFPVAGDLLSENRRTTIQRVEQWRRGRRVMHHLTNVPILHKYGDWYESETVKMLNSYAKAPQNWFVHHSQFAASVLFRLLYGKAYEDKKEALDLAQRVPMEFVHAVNNVPVDFFPWLAKIPVFMQFWRNFWIKIGDKHRRFVESCFKPCEALCDAGEAPSCFTRDTLLAKNSQFQGTREQAMFVTQSIMGAGMQNTRMTLNTFVMALATHPEVLERMRKELDDYMAEQGEFRLPATADMEALPYCSAVVKELLRWRPTIPIVPQHQLTEAFEFEGYYFPPDTDFLVNNVAMSYQWIKDPEKFRPERYIDNGNEQRPITNLWAFGGGRRICVGYKVFQLSSWLAFTRMVSCFDIVADGPIDTVNLNHPNLDTAPFPIKITPRSEKHLELIDHAMQSVT